MDKSNRKIDNNVALLRHQEHLHTLDKTSTFQNADEIISRLSYFLLVLFILLDLHLFFFFLFSNFCLQKS